MRNRGIKNEQWTYCDRCGRPYPMSHIIGQKGLAVCRERCTDQLEIELHSRRVAEVLNQGVAEEGADLRFIDAAFFKDGLEVS